MTLFYYDTSTRFSGQLLYDNWYMVLFNVLLTSLPVIALGVLEQDVSPDVCLQVLINISFFISISRTTISFLIARYVSMLPHLDIYKYSTRVIVLFCLCS